jgi:hypothetical protein
MTSISLPQALYTRQGDEPPILQARSPDFADTWLPEVERIVTGFGVRPVGTGCPFTVFALPLTGRHIALVRVAEQTPGARGALAFHFLTIERTAYERFAGDPFQLARQLPATWDARGEMPPLPWSAAPVPARSIADVQKVLKRVKASGLREDEDPDSPDFERTAENSESPALLGGVQVLVDGGRLIFARPEGDLALVEGLWTLLPASTRSKLWPASFAFSNELGFDVVVLPRVSENEIDGYTTEEQAINYPQGSYELALQTAAESGSQRDLDAVFQRRNSSEMLRLAMVLLIGMMLLVIGSRWFVPQVEPVGPTLQQQKTATAAGIVAVGNPWTAASMLEYGMRLWSER